ncbi:cryptochrome-1 [Pseudoscourfieldia marina]
MPQARGARRSPRQRQNSKNKKSGIPAGSAANAAAPTTTTTTAAAAPPPPTAAAPTAALPRPNSNNGEVSVVWFRRDLRTDDNPALNAAVAAGRPILPIFIWEPEEQGQFQPGRGSRWWLNRSLARLEDDLKAIGARLAYLRGTTALRALRSLFARVDVKELFFNNLYDAVSLARDCSVKETLNNEGVTVTTFNADLLYEPWEVLGSGGEPFHTFEAFWSRMQCLSYAPRRPESAPARIALPSSDVFDALREVACTRDELALLTEDEDRCTESLSARWRPGGHGARRIFESFCRHALESFSWERAKVDIASTSQLSPHMHYGEISVRRIYYAVKDLEYAAARNETRGVTALSEEAEPPAPYDEMDDASTLAVRRRRVHEDARRTGCRLGDDTPAGMANMPRTPAGAGSHHTAGKPAREVEGPHGEYLRCLGLREWSRYLSFFYPFTHERSLLSQLRAVPWNYDETMFHRWKMGTTGYPLVDAAMRQLWSTGWLHNRMRMVVASFLVKHLLLPWQWGLRHFWECQLDADLESDVLGWQYVSGCLADGHTFMTQIDLEMEARRFDPNGNYVRRWITQLSRLPTQHIHAPWLAPTEVLAAAGVELGSDGGYPLPIVDPAESKERLQRAVDHLRRIAINGGQATNALTAEVSTAPVPPAESGDDEVGEHGGNVPLEGAGSPEEMSNSHAAGCPSREMSPTAAKRSEVAAMDGIDFGKGTLPPTLRDVHDDMCSIDRMNKRKRSSS